MRKVHPNDPIPDWRDPEMEVWWRLEDSWTGKIELVALQPWEAQQMMRDLFNDNNGSNWRNDPTYNLAKKRRQR